MSSDSILYHSEGCSLPIPPRLQRLIRLAPWLLRVPLFASLVLRRFLHVRASQISPGFYAVVPDYLSAESVNLNDTVFINYASVSIGAGTRFSGENILLTSTHCPGDFSKVIARPIKIGRNVWITYRCIILGGVTIGDNVVIGAGSVVTKDIPSNVVAAGNPCQVIRVIN
ncbi:hypothetical protein B0T45_12735 [Chromobacterium haemolyticum]|uniref:Acetyltransferase n=1 Tax=Chromobacterium haemolyticum TaxID=394935 RepID=A0A1W0CV48_9NEIS|nr:hypothetical protein B0T45_12735 [Chromobacterium haemolyticum]